MSCRCKVGCPHGALALALALTLITQLLFTKDVFSLPMALFTPDAKKFARELGSSYLSRCLFDGGYYSEPVMYLRVYMAWLSSPRSMAWCKCHCLSFLRMRQLDQVPGLGRRVRVARMGYECWGCWVTSASTLPSPSLPFSALPFPFPPPNLSPFSLSPFSLPPFPFSL
jgi:hypothetical protein